MGNVDLMRLYRSHKTDGPHAAIRDGLRKAGYTVHDTSVWGHGFPDLAVPIRRLGVTVLLEIKTSPKAHLNDAQIEFHTWWSGPVAVVCTLSEAMRYLQLIEGKPTGQAIEQKVRKQP